MSEETQLILKVIAEQEKTREAQIKLVVKEMGAGFEVISIDLKALKKTTGEIKEAKLIQNGRVNLLEKNTQVSRWVESNPFKSILVLVLFIGGCVALFENFTIIEIINFIKNFKS